MVYLNRNYVIAFIRDITEDEVQRRENEKYRFFLESILENLPIATTVKDKNDEGRYLIWNKKAAEMMEVPAEDIVGHYEEEFKPLMQDNFIQETDKEVGAAFHLTEVLENFLVFVPMGIYLQMLLPRTKLYVKFMLIAGTSFLLETMQYILAVGRSDITDVLTNTAGGLLGLAVYSMAARLIGNRIKANRLFSILAGIVSVVVIGLLGLLLFANR